MIKTDNYEISIEKVYGSPREVADRARTTIGLDGGNKVISQDYMRKLYICEHSPVRIRSFIIKVKNVPYWIAMHFVRHHVGFTPFVSTQRDDRNPIVEDRDSTPQGSLVTLEMHANAQAIINISRKRLCMCAHQRTRDLWKQILIELRAVDEPLVSACVRECVYRGFCPEFKSCGFTKNQSQVYENMLEAYRRDYNEK